MKRLAIALVIILACGVEAIGQEFRLPRPPAELTSVPQRAGWLIEHYWDLADIQALAESHEAASGSVSELEQAFVNYLSLFPLAESNSLCHASVARLMQAADGLSQAADGLSLAADGGAGTMDTILSLAEKYLFQLQSPMANEAYFSHFVDAAAACPGLSQMRRGDCEYWARVIASNRVGSQVADFSFELADGSEIQFSSIAGERLLLLFDITCKDCQELIARLRESAPAGVRVVAVAINTEMQSFLPFAAGLPESWVVGYDSTGAVNGVAFAIRRLPDVYRIAADGTVLDKHCSTF